MTGENEGVRSAADLPLLPRGTVVFTDLPARALVLEALAPSIGNGVLRVRSRQGTGFVLVREGALYETNSFVTTGRHTGAAALDEMRSWPDADVSADRLDVALVDLSAALVRAECIYEDLRLQWTSWSGLLADLSRREAAYIVELTTSAGRGVTCVAGGRQLLSYTDVHPSLGDPAMLEAMASSGDGQVRIRRVSPVMFGSLIQEGAGVPVRQASAPGAAMVWPDPLAPLSAPPAHLHADEPAAPGPSRQAPAPEVAPAAAGRDVPENHERDASDLGWVAPWQVAWGEAAPDEPEPASSPLHRLTVVDVHHELREIAKRRLQMSASRVEVALDSAAAQDLPLDRVLEDLRSLSIRGVMQPTIDAMVDEMTEAAGRRVG